MITIFSSSFATLLESGDGSLSEVRLTVLLPASSYQTAQLRGTLIASLASGDVLKEKDIYMGKPIGKERQIMVDKMVLKKFMKGKQGIFVGLTSYRKFIGRKIVIPNLGIYRICGISDVDSPVMFAHPSRLINIIAKCRKNEPARSSSVRNPRRQYN